jgi:hypothetical protein
MRYRQECWMSGDFMLCIEPTDKSLEKYHVAVLRGTWRGYALYRSKREFPESEAKAEAVKHGIRIARREARICLAISESLVEAKRQAKSSPPRDSGAVGGLNRAGNGADAL